MMVSVINIRDMLSSGQEELIRSYLETYSCIAEKDGVRKHLNPDCEADAELIQFYEGQYFTLFGERISERDGKRYLQYLRLV